MWPVGVAKGGQKVFTGGRTVSLKIDGWTECVVCRLTGGKMHHGLRQTRDNVK